jgi:hypothetical protein
MSKLYAEITAFSLNDNANDESENTTRKDGDNIDIMGDFNNKIIVDYLIDNEHDIQVQLLTLDLKNKWEHLGLLTTINYIDIMKILEQTMCVNEIEYEENEENIDYDEYTYTYLDESEKNILL